MTPYDFTKSDLKYNLKYESSNISRAEICNYVNTGNPIPKTKG